jgi:hypothetical protein
MLGLPAQDQLLPVSWRARPGDFVSLMTVYESNYLRLRQLVPQLSTLERSYISKVTGESPLLLAVQEISPYTSTFNLSYVFDEGYGAILDPDLQVRVYHDAGMAEVLSCARWHRHEVLNAIKSELFVNLGERWLKNMMLNKWLDYCLTLGHEKYWQEAV